MDYCLELLPVLAKLYKVGEGYVGAVRNPSAHSKQISTHDTLHGQQLNQAAAPARQARTSSGRSLWATAQLLNAHGEFASSC